MNDRDQRELQIRRNHAELSRVLLTMCRGIGSRMVAELTPEARESLLYWADVVEDELRAIKTEMGDG